ncbi:MAG: hypothetical protein ACQES8_09665 [Thermodesulfobacteriota bacterium]
MFLIKKLRIYLLVVIICAITPAFTMAGDLDDGISKYTDDGIAKYDELGKPEKNVKYIIRNAKSKAAMAQKNGNASASGGSGDSNMNSVVMGAGSNIKGDIYIIDESKGDKTQVSE